MVVSAVAAQFFFRNEPTADLDRYIYLHLFYTADGLPNRCFDNDLHLTAAVASAPAAPSTALEFTH